MNQGRIIVITGAPGTGKTTTASAVAKESDLEKSVHMHTDDFYHYLSKGAIPPHLPESNEQNLIVIEAFLEAAKRYARGGYDVIVDGIVGPWFLEPWLNIVQEHYIVGFAFGYILLKPDGRKVFYLDAIDVMPDFQGKGYGTGLISFARDYAKTIDCYEMFLITNRSNISACKCYEKAGGINDADDEVVYVYDFREEN